MFRNFIYLNNVLPVFENSLCVLCECKLSISEYHQTFTWKHGCKDKHLASYFYFTLSLAHKDKVK